MTFFQGLALCLAALLYAFPAAAEGRPPLSLHEAIKTALERSPSLAAAADRGEAMKAATSKAGVFPNPEVSVEAENFGGGGPYKDFDSVEITYGVSQRIELPGKRSGRIGIASAEQEKAMHERESERLNLIRDVVTAYAALAAAEEELKILQEEKSLALNVYESVAAKVDAGKEPPIQKNKAAIALSSSGIALERARRSAITAGKVLANLMGRSDRDFSVSPGTLPVMKEPQDLNIYAEMLAYSPENRVYDANIDAARSSLSHEKANMAPDPTVNVGMRDYREDGDQAFIAGLSIPFPIFDANRAGMRRAGHEYNAAMMDKAQAQLSAQSDLVRSYEALSNAYQEHKTLKGTVLPGAQEAFDTARAGYAAGKFGYLEVLDAQRTLFDARKQSIRAMLDYYTALAVIDRLTALHDSTKKEKRS